MERLAELLKTRDFGSLHHSFYTALPRITYAGIGEDVDGWDPAELQNMQGEEDMHECIIISHHADPPYQTSLKTFWKGWSTPRRRAMGYSKCTDRSPTIPPNR